MARGASSPTVHRATLLHDAHMSYILRVRRIRPSTEHFPQGQVRRIVRVRRAQRRAKEDVDCGEAHDNARALGTCFMRIRVSTRHGATVARPHCACERAVRSGNRALQNRPQRICVPSAVSVRPRWEHKGRGASEISRDHAGVGAPPTDFLDSMSSQCRAS